MKVNFDFDVQYIKNYITNFDLIKNNIISVSKECFKFSGKLNRTKFFTFAIFLMILGFLISSVSSAITYIIGLVFNSSILTMLFSLFFGILAIIPAIMGIGPCLRRLRDAGFSPWFYLLCFCCLGIVPLVMSLFPSEYPEDTEETETKPEEPVFCPEAKQPSENN